MLFVDNNNITDPRINLAIEEHLLRNLDVTEPILLFYINEPAVIIGRNQNTLEEIDPDYTRTRDIHVVRRLSGGGAVYHDLGNLNFSFVTPGRRDLHNFAKFTEPVITVLRELGVDAELRGKSDIFAGDKKISGNAQFSSRGRMFSHGTLLFDTDLGEMLRAINPQRHSITSKAVQSVRNYVTNIRELLTEEMDIHEFRARLLQGIFDGASIPEYELERDDWALINKLTQERYYSWNWNVGRSPKFNVQRQGETAVGDLDVRIDVERGHIQSIKIYGRFAGPEDMVGLEKQLTGVRYEPDDLAAALADVDLSAYLGEELDRDELLQLLY